LSFGRDRPDYRSYFQFTNTMMVTRGGAAEILLNLCPEFSVLAGGKVRYGWCGNVFYAPFCSLLKPAYLPRLPRDKRLGKVEKGTSIALQAAGSLAA
jgi:hypothetical protein